MPPSLPALPVPPPAGVSYPDTVKRLVVLSLATILLAVVGVGCNTAHGFGEDVEKAGAKIQDGTK